MRVVFLGTASCFPTPTRGVSCLAVQHDDGQVWLFDCGEGSQIQLQKSSIKPGKITKVFITHLHGDHVFGLPGLLCTLGNGAATESKSVDIYGPLGIRRLVTTNLELSRSPLPYKFRVHEIVPAPSQYPEDWEAWPTRLESDCLTPPEETTRKVEQRGGEWFLFEEGNFRVSAGPIKHRIPSFAYVLSEKDQLGSLNVDKLRSLGLPPGPLYAKLKKGETVVTDSGQSIKPEEVTGPTKKGKKVVVLGDTCDTQLIEDMSANCDLVIHEATMENALREKAIEFGHSTPGMAADFAHKIGAKKLCLTHVSPRYKPFQGSQRADDGGGGSGSSQAEGTEQRCGDEKSQSAKILLDEAQRRLQEIGSMCEVVIAEDFYELPVV